MSIARRGAGWLAALVLTMGLTGPVQASPLDFLKTITAAQIPGVPVWKVGQQATHKVTYTDADGSFTGDLRVAVTGQEEEYFWLELNLTNPGGTMGQELAGMLPALHLRFLTKPTDKASIAAITKAAVTNPMNAFDDSLKKIQFQVPGMALYELELNTLKSTVSPYVPDTVTDPESGTIPEPKGDIKFDAGREKVTVPGGTFNNSLFWDVIYTETGNSGNAHVNMDETIPLVPLAKALVNASGKDVGGNMQVKIELQSTSQTGAKTQTTGVPEPFDINKLLGAFMGGATLE